MRPVIRQHGGRLGDISIFGQESNPTTWRLAKMKLAIRGIEANLGPEAADTFHKDLHTDLRADFILANPPFNMTHWGGETPAYRSQLGRRPDFIYDTTAAIPSHGGKERVACQRRGPQSLVSYLLKNLTSRSPAASCRHIRPS